MIVGADIGFSHIKLATPNYTVKVPSAVGAGAFSEMSGAAVAAGRKAVSTEGVRLVQLGEKTWRVGASSYLLQTARTDMGRFAEGSDIVKAPLFAGLYDLAIGRTNIMAEIVVGLPLALVRTSADARKMREGIRGWLLGFHEFRIDDLHQVYLDVQQVDIQSQPAGGLIATGILEHANVMLVDWGFMTLHTAAFEGMRYNLDATWTSFLGVHKAAAALVNLVDQKYGVRLQLHEADRHLELGLPLHAPGGPYDISHLVDQALDMTHDEACRFIQDQLDKVRYDRLIFVGGGAWRYEKHIMNRWPHAEIGSDPIFQCARGLCEYGLHQWGSR